MARKTAPNVSVGGRYVDIRSQTSREYDSKDKDFVHIWQRADITQDELKRVNMEVVKGEDGALIPHGGDILCRKPREVYEAERRAESEYSLERVAKLSKDRRKLVKEANPVKVGED